MEKIDLKKKLQHLYNASPKEAALVEVPPLNFLMVDGAGDPNASSDLQSAVEALYDVSYTIKFLLKDKQSLDYGVMPLEGLWDAQDPTRFSLEDKASWKWTLMIMQPKYVTLELVQQGIEKVQKKKKSPPIISRIRMETFQEGLSAQILHVGPFGDLGPTIEKLHKFAQEKGHALRGRHHEIYLSNPSRTAPEKLKTILRQPVT
jgi:hypothetical protein